jgi:hypothetical protein
MKTVLSLTLLSITLTISYSAFSSQVATQTAQIKTSSSKNFYDPKDKHKIVYAIKRDETGKQICYTGINFLTGEILKYELDSATGQCYGTTQTEGLLCINPTSENKFLADMYEGTSMIAAPASAPATTQSSSSQSSSTATSTQALGTTATIQVASAQAQSSSTASSLIASVMSYFRKS